MSQAPHYTGKEEEYLLEAIDSGTLSSYYGEKTKACEQAFERILGGGVRAVTCINNVIALHVILRALECTVGDEVIVEPLGPEGAEAVCVNNAVPVFADIDPDTLTLAPDSVAERITDRTRAIVVRHTFGAPCRLEEILAIASERGLPVVEDASDAIAAQYKDGMVGIWGRAAVFDFAEGNAISVGQGSICVSADLNVANWVHRYVTVGRAMDTDVHYDSRQGLVSMEDVVARRFLISELEGAVGLAQMERFEELVSVHLQSARRISAAYGGLSFLRPQKVQDTAVHGYGRIVFIYEGHTLGVPLDRFVTALREAPVTGASVNPHPRPTYLEPAIQEDHIYKHGCPVRCPLYGGNATYEQGICPVAEDVATRLVFAEPCETEAEAESRAAQLDAVFTSLQKPER